VFVLVLLVCVAPAVAHGPAPAATGVFEVDADGPSWVRLTRGLAQRAPAGFRFVCPEAWDGNIIAPIAAIPGGPLVVASESLFLIAPDGQVAPHPSELGAGVALANNRDALFGLFKRAGQYELQRVSQSASELVRLLEEPFDALAASDSQLFLLGSRQRTLWLQMLSLTGELGERVTWNAPHDVAYAELRLAHEQLYVVVWGRSAPWVTLGRVTPQGYEPLREANTDIAGPIALGEDALLALDGRVETLREGAPLAGLESYVTCLGSEHGQAYACAHNDVLRVDQDGLGAALFEVAALQVPDYEALAPRVRPDCVTRWLDVEEHVAMLAESDSVGASGAADAGPSAAAQPSPSSAKPGGCAIGVGGEHARWLGATFVLVLGLWRRARAARRR
jgi:hypothetical protein